jgi:addiction module RelE/StbE family toxin
MLEMGLRPVTGCGALVAALAAGRIGRKSVGNSHARTAPRLTDIGERIEDKLATHPIEFGKPLRYSLKGARRLRVQDWRVIYTIEPPDVVLIAKIGHRKEVYQP